VGEGGGLFVLSLVNSKIALFCIKKMGNSFFYLVDENPWLKLTSTDNETTFRKAIDRNDHSISRVQH